MPDAADTQPVVELTLRFRVVDEPLLRSLARDAVAEYGQGVELTGDLGQAIAELLLHSNPDIAGYLDYGIELLNTTTGGSA